MYKKEGVRPFFGANSYIIPLFFYGVVFKRLGGCRLLRCGFA